MADATLDDFIGDAAAWAEYLSRQDFRRIVLIGHSEGALIAFCAAQQCPEVDAVISVAGAGYPLDEYSSFSWPHNSPRRTWSY